MPSRLSKILMLFCLVLFSGKMFASCAAMTPCQYFGASDVVFTGRVTKSIVDESHPDLGAIRVGFDITEGFKGVEGKSVIDIDGPFDLEFQMGKEYLVFAKLQEGHLSPTLCEGAGELAYRAEELRFLHRLSQLPAGGTLFGTFVLRDFWATQNQSSVPLGNIRISLTGDHGGKSGRMKSNGRYKISKIPAGTYTLRIALPPTLIWEAESSRFSRSPSPRKVTITDRGCYQKDLTILHNGSISGHLVAAPGMDVSDVIVEAMELSTKHIAGIAWTDVKGDYQINGIPSGKYLLGINLLGPPTSWSPFERVLYPGAKDLKDAQAIDVDVARKATGYDLPFGGKLELVDVSIVAKMPDGRPVERALVSYEGVDEPKEQLGSAFTDKDGHAVLKMLKGKASRIRATSFSGSRLDICAGPLFISPQDTKQKVELVFSIETCTNLFKR